MRSREAILFRTPTQVNVKELLREVHAAEEGLEAGIVAEGVKPRIHKMANQAATKVLQGFFQHRKGRIFLPTRIFGWL